MPGRAVHIVGYRPLRNGHVQCPHGGALLLSMVAPILLVLGAPVTLGCGRCPLVGRPLGRETDLAAHNALLARLCQRSPAGDKPHLRTGVGDSPTARLIMMPAHDAMMMSCGRP
jgi:hypothetical protein